MRFGRPEYGWRRDSGRLRFCHPCPAIETETETRDRGPEETETGTETGPETGDRTRPRPRPCRDETETVTEDRDAETERDRDRDRDRTETVETTVSSSSQYRLYLDGSVPSDSGVRFLDGLPARREPGHGERHPWGVRSPYKCKAGFNSLARSTRRCCGAT